MFTKLQKELDKKLKEPAYQHEGEDYYVGICTAQQIADQVEKEFYKENPIFKYALMYAEHIKKYGIDITEKWETATQNAAALNEAYMRGRQDERERFARCQEEKYDGFCEWKHYELDLLLPYGTSCGQSDLYDDCYKYCPYCGKKIKIV
jgi:hypothetical protein